MDEALEAAKALSEGGRQLGAKTASVVLPVPREGKPYEPTLANHGRQEVGR